MIALGSDLIQGYYIAKPASYILRELPETLKNEIVELNRMRSGYEIRVYCPKEDEVVDLARITAEHYNALLIETEHVTVQGVPGTAINCSIAIRDGLHTHITLKDVYITTEKEGPLLDLGNFTNATVTLEGDNEIINRGIRVPQSSDLHLTGEGSLHIHSEMLNSYGIGNDGGSLDCSTFLTSTDFYCEGNTVTGIGDINGSGSIHLRDSNLTMRILARDNLDIGSKYGKLETINIQKQIKVNE